MESVRNPRCLFVARHEDFGCCDRESLVLPLVGLYYRVAAAERRALKFWRWKGSFFGGGVIRLCKKDQQKRLKVESANDFWRCADVIVDMLYKLWRSYFDILQMFTEYHLWSWNTWAWRYADGTMSCGDRIPQLVLWKPFRSQSESRIDNNKKNKNIQEQQQK